MKNNKLTRDFILYLTKNKVLMTVCVAMIFSTMATAQTQFKSLNYLYSISGSKIISGQHNDQKDGTTVTTYTDRVNSITGKYPALWSGDFLFHGNSQMRWDVTYEAERQWNAGAIINIMWHACPPTQNAVCDWDGGLLSHLSDEQWNDLITDGGNLNTIWKSRIDEIAVYLQYLEDKGVEVLWRPLHEMNQGSFWWGGRTGPNGTRRLYQITRDYMQNVKGLTNLIWVWDVQDMSTNYGDYNPGNNYWDVAALDIYGDGYTNTSYYNALLQQAGNKPMAIGECSTLPGANIFSTQPRWTFFMNWAYMLQQNNTDQYIRDVYSDSRVVTRDEMPGWGSVNVPSNLAKGKSVWATSTESGSTNYAANGVDGNYGTRWSSAYADNQNYVVDLGANYNLNRIKITWEAAYAKDYQIQISSDNSTWLNVKDVFGKTSSAADDHTGLNATGRYLKIYCISRATTYGFSFWELEAYGSTSGGATNLAYNKSVVTSSNENTTNTGPKGVDANGTTRWSSSYANNQNYIVDLGAQYNINRIKIAWEAAYAKDYQVQISTDNVNWTNLKEVWGKTSSATDDFSGLSGVGRWIKIYCINRATSYGFSFWEFEVYGTYVGARLDTEDDATPFEGILTYPNPAEDKLTINLSNRWKNGGNISIHNSSGKVLMTEKIKSGEQVLDISNLPPGLYLINFSSSNERKSYKIFKN